MKRTLLLVMISIAQLSFGQKQMTALTIYEMNEDGTINYIDSNAYFYNNISLGAMNQFLPKFSFFDYTLDYTLPDNQDHFLIHCDSSQLHDSSSQPISFSSSTLNSISNGRITSAVEDGTYTQNYTYDAAGNMLTYVDKNYNGTTTQSYDSVIYTYDANNNRISKWDYSLNNGVELNAVDSMFYITGTNLIEEYLKYEFNSTTNVLELEMKIEASYSGNQVQTLKIYDGNNGGTPVWMNEIQFTYAGNTPTGFLGYDVVNNMPTPAVVASANYNFDTQNQLTESSLQSGSDTILKTQYVYDNDGFVTKRIEFNADSNNDMFEYLITNYYFENSLGLNELNADNIIVYPNPAIDVLNVQTDAQIKSVSVFNLQGQLVIQQNGKQVDLRHLQQGQYIIRINSNEGDFTSKFFKK